VERMTGGLFDMTRLSDFLGEPKDSLSSGVTMTVIESPFLNRPLYKFSPFTTIKTTPFLSH
jgi:hypothetical protein